MHSSRLRLTLLPHARPALFGGHASAAQDLTDSLARQAEYIADLLQGFAPAVEAADDRLALQVSLWGSHGRYLAHNLNQRSSG